MDLFPLFLFVINWLVLGSRNNIEIELKISFSNEEIIKYCFRISQLVKFQAIVPFLEMPERVMNIIYISRRKNSP